MNKSGSDGRGSCKVYGVMNMAEILNVVVTGSGDEDLFGKSEGRVKDRAEIFSKRN